MGKLTLENDKFVCTKSDNNASSFYVDKDSELEKQKFYLE